MGALHDALDRLRKAAAADPEEKAAIDRLAALVDRQEELVEQFKSKNALLQNSLAYFGLFSARLATSDRNEPLVAAASTLAAAMLHLTLNTSPATALAVEERLDKFATLSSRRATPSRSGRCWRTDECCTTFSRPLTPC